MDEGSKITTGFVISVVSAFAGLLVRLNVKALSATRFNYNGVTGTEWSIEKQSAWGQIGLALIIFGLVLFVVVFNQWLKQKSAPIGD